jgi:predicted RNA-binding protein YlxR (DUF448 family)
MPKNIRITPNKENSRCFWVSDERSRVRRAAPHQNFNLLVDTSFSHRYQQGIINSTPCSPDRVINAIEKAVTTTNLLPDV